MIEYMAMKGKNKNIEIIEEKLLSEISDGFKRIDERIGSLYQGIFGFFVNPIIKMLYDLEARDAIVRRAMQQLHILIKCANEFDGNLDVVVKKNLEDYLKTEEAYIRANKNHESFPQLVSLLEEIFRTRVYIITELLRGKGETYDELVRTAFSREEVEKVTRKQFELAERVINLVKEEKGLIRIPFIIRLEVFRLLETEFDWYKRNIEEEINKMYER